MVGTAIITYYLYVNRGDTSFVLFAYWIVTLFACEISGAHFNPAVTIAQMFRQNSNFGSRRLKGLLYILFQIFGAMIGAILITTLLRIDEDPAYKRPTPITGGTMNSCISETFGSFFFILFFMISTDRKTQYSTDKVCNCLVVAGAYIAARGIAGGELVTHESPLLNPAIALGYAMFGGSFSYPQYIFMPFLGSLAALVFYEMVFVKTIIFLADEDKQEEAAKFITDDGEDYEDD